MWIGIGYGIDGEGTDRVVLFVQERREQRPFTICAGPEQIAEVVAFLRDCRRDGVAVLMPECQACHAPLDLPDLDAVAEEAA